MGGEVAAGAEQSWVLSLLNVDESGDKKQWKASEVCIGEEKKQENKRSSYFRKKT